MISFLKNLPKKNYQKKFTKARFMAQDVISSGEYSVCT